MKLYRAKIPVIAADIIRILSEAGDIEVDPAHRSEAEQDLEAIMGEYLRRDNQFRGRIKDYMASRNLPYSEFGRIRSQIAEEDNHPTGSDVERYLTRQFLENLMISPNVEEVYTEDRLLHRKILGVLKSHHVDEDEIRREAMAKVKNIQEGTVDYEIALQNAVREVKKRRGL